MKKRFFIFLEVLILFFFLIGCGEKGIELKIFIKQPRFKAQYTKYLNQFVKKYKEENGVDISYNLEMPNPQNADELLRTRFASDEGLDIYTLHPINDMRVYDKAGHVEDLSAQPFVDKLIDSVREVVSVDGKVKCVPMESLAWGYLYNKTIFEELKIKPALTLSEMASNVEKIKTAGYTPFLLSYNEVWVPQLFTPLIVGGLLNSKYPDFLDNMNAGKGSFAELKEFFDIIDLVHANGTDRALDLDPMSGCTDFAFKKAVMWIQGPWYADQILKNAPDFQLGVAPLPINNDPNATLINVAVSTGLAVHPKSKNKEIAFAFLNYVLDDQDSSDFYQSMKFNPVSKNHKFEVYPWVDTAMQYVRRGKCYTDISIPQSVKDESGRQLQMYYLKNNSKEDIIKALDKTWKNSLKVTQ